VAAPPSLSAGGYQADPGTRGQTHGGLQRANLARCGPAKRSPLRINGNVANNGLITNLPPGSCVEVPWDQIQRMTEEAFDANRPRFTLWAPRPERGAAAAWPGG
jgi:Family 4 glycosyl hydrolase C-terminal domain